MLTHPTVDQLLKLGLAGMARAFAELQAQPTAPHLGHAEWLALLLDREAAERYTKRRHARLRSCSAAPARRHRGRRLARRRAASIARCSRRLSPATGSTRRRT